MKTSVVMSTARWGGLDITLSGLQAQTRKPDLLVIVDEWWHFRVDQIRDLFSPLAGELNVVWPGNENLSRMRVGQGFNAGAKFVTDGLLILMNDYMWVPPDWVERMAHYSECYPGYSLTGASFRYPAPALREDVQFGAYSMFKEEFKSSHLEGLEPSYKDMKSGITPGAPGGMGNLPWDKWYGGINESVAAEIYHKVGGYDERMDGGSGAMDIDLALRCTLSGHRFAFDPTLVTHEFKGASHDSLYLHRCSYTQRTNGIPPACHDRWRQLMEGSLSLDWRQNGERS